VATKKQYRFDDKAFDDPVVFITTFLRHPDGSKIEPHEAQIAIIQAFMSGTFDLIIVAGRQFGKSTVLGWLIVWYILHFSNRHVYIVAPSLDQARIIYDEVARHFEGPLRVMLKRKPIEFPFPHIELLNGSHVHGRGANSPKYLRGKLVHLLIEDEAAFFKDGIHPNTIEPMFTVTSKMDYTGIIRISTPFGEGDFYDGALAAQADTTGRSKYMHFTSFDNPYANKDMLYAIRDRYGEDSLIWRTEYMAEFADSDMAVFNSADIKWAYQNYPYQTQEGRIEYPVPAVAGHTYVQGVDLANIRDYFVATVLDSTDPRLAVQVRHDRMQKKGYSVYKDVVRANWSAYNSARTLVDATSLGESVVEDLRDINAEGYKFSGTEAKYDLVHNLVRMFNEHRIAIPFDRDLVDELRYFQYKITPSKNVKMEAKQGHDDYVMSLSMAGQLASRPAYVGRFLGGLKGRIDVKPTRLPPHFDPFAHLDA
jgi:phage terminase large subunit-like protein